MQTKQVIQSSVNVVRITNISKGNIYKRFDDYDYTYYGIVTDVHNDGNNTIIEATEYKYSYSSIDVQHKVIKGDKEYVIFPATLEDLQNEFGKCIDTKEREIENKLKEIESAKKLIATTQKLLSGEMQKELSTPIFKEMTQEDFNEKVKQLN